MFIVFISNGSRETEFNSIFAYSLVQIIVLYGKYRYNYARRYPVSEHQQDTRLTFENTLFFAYVMPKKILLGQENKLQNCQ